MTPAISIVTICFENPDELRRTLLSCAQLDRGNYEVIVIDGSPHTVDCQLVLSDFPWVRSIHERDNGRYDAMNKGVALSQGRSVMMLNSGDVLGDRSALDAVVVSHLADLDNSIIYGDALVEILGRRVFARAPDIEFENLRKGTLPCHQSVLVPTSYAKAHPYNEALAIAADTQFLRRAFSELPAIYLPTPLSIFRFGGASNTPAGWRGLFAQYRETVGVRDLTTHEALQTLFGLVTRKVYADLFGEYAMQRVQLRRAMRRAGSGSAPAPSPSA